MASKNKQPQLTPSPCQQLTLNEFSKLWAPSYIAPGPLIPSWQWHSAQFLHDRQMEQKMSSLPAVNFWTMLHHTICFLANDMNLAVHLDASYLSEFGGKSRAGGHYFLTNDKHTINNGPILTFLSSSSTWLVWLWKWNWLPCFTTESNLCTSNLPLLNGVCTTKTVITMDMPFNWLKCRQAKTNSFTNGSVAIII